MASGGLDGIIGAGSGRPVPAVGGLTQAPGEAALAKKAADGRSSSPAEMARIRQAARDFEAIFVHQMLKAMRQASARGKVLLGGTGQKFYQDMMDDELSKAMSRAGGLGLADLLIRDIVRRQTVPKKASSAAPAGPIEGTVGRDTSEGDAR